MTLSDKRKTVLVYRDIILPSSETFIKDQTEGLNRYNSYYVGSRKTQGLLELKREIHVLNEDGNLGRLKEIGFKTNGLTFNWGNKLKKLNPNLIHAHFGPDGALALPLAKKLGVPLIITFHGYDITVNKEDAVSFSQKKYYKNLSKIQNNAYFIAVSNFIKDKMISKGFPKEKIIQHYIGINTERFTPDKNIKREKIVLFVGRLVEKKGLEYLIKSMKLVQEQIPDCSLVVIGDGPLRKKLETLAGSLLKNFKFLGVQTPLQVKEWMNRSQIFSVPSIVAENGDAEGFGMVFAEANSMGLPVVSFETGGITESVLNNKTGFLLKEKDVEGLSTKIIELLSNPILWNTFSQNGIERVSKQFNLKIQNELLEQIYDEIISESSGKN